MVEAIPIMSVTSAPQMKKRTLETLREATTYVRNRAGIAAVVVVIVAKDGTRFVAAWDDLSGAVEKGTNT